MPARIPSDDEEMDGEPQTQSALLPYDTDQDREEKRQVRKGYRQLQDDGEQCRYLH